MEVKEKMKAKIRSNLGTVLDSKGLKNKWVAEKIEATESQIANWSKNQKDGQVKSTPHVGYVLKLEKLLDVRVGEMFEIIEEE